LTQEYLCCHRETVFLARASVDREQFEIGTSPEFWNLMRSRRKEKTLSRAELERAVRGKIKRKHS
jgi:hypothetical protein